MRKINQIILASASPRRKDLLASLRWNFQVHSPHIDETAFGGESPPDLCKRLSLTKAQSAADIFPNALVIAADTLVVVGDRIFGKPRDKEHAAEMLSALSGVEHKVFTGVTTIFQGKHVSEVEVTNVHFHNLSQDEIGAYVNTEEPMDKAGGYAIQGFGALIVKRIEGDYFNVVGLPLQLLGVMLRKINLSLSDQFSLGVKK